MDQTHYKRFLNNLGRSLKGNCVHRYYYDYMLLRGGSGKCFWKLCCRMFNHCRRENRLGSSRWKSSRTSRARELFLLPHPDSSPECEWFARPSPRRSSFSWSKVENEGQGQTCFSFSFFFLPHRQTWLSELWPIGRACCPVVRWYMRHNLTFYS